MHARPTIRAVLIRQKLRRWCDIAQCPLIDLRCPPWRARRNYWRLLKAYPQEAAAMGLTETSVYER